MLAQAIQLNPLITSKLECCLINGMGTPNIQQFAIFRSILGIILPGKVLVKHCEAASLFFLNHLRLHSHHQSTPPGEPKEVQNTSQPQLP
jgi:hypothetical protein